MGLFKTGIRLQKKQMSCDFHTNGGIWSHCGRMFTRNVNTPACDWSQIQRSHIQNSCISSLEWDALSHPKPSGCEEGRGLEIA